MIPRNITAEHIIKAIEEINDSGLPKNQWSRKFDLIYRGQVYPPKYVISLAHKYANGYELTQSGFKAGKETNTFLMQLGFEIIAKSNLDVYDTNGSYSYLNDEWFLLLNELIDAVILRHQREAHAENQPEELQFGRLQRSVMNSIAELEQWREFRNKHHGITGIPLSVAMSRNGVWAEYSSNDIQEILSQVKSERLPDSVLEKLMVLERLLAAFSTIQFILEDAFSFGWTGSAMWYDTMGGNDYLNEEEKRLYKKLFSDEFENKR